jgi:ElaB/YqjD/DUF883 family membrane-anchored ribosome-binding protein
MSILTRSRVTATRPSWEQARDAIEDARKQVNRAVAEVRHTAEDATSAAAMKIRRNPLTAVGAAACAGSAIGALLGFSTGWWMKSRR